jgi:hypothetical protein
MQTGSDVLIAHGFVTKDAKGKYKGENPREIRQNIKKDLRSKKGKEKKEFLEQLRKDADHDQFEVVKNQLVYVDYPKPLNKYYLLTETFHQSIEPLYFWSLNHLKYDLNFGWIEKITDIFSASEHSSFWGAATSRLGLAQDKVQGYLALIGQFIRKDLFQLVRDIRWIDERLDYHKKAREGSEDAEIVLKGIWSDMVDGVVQGQRTGANIFQMAQQFGFTHLPDIWFKLNPKDVDSVKETVDNVDTTLPVKQILKRKLHEFMTWREHNYTELQQRRNFEVKYLRQHYNIVKMYMSWVKPYLTHIQRLRQDVSKLGQADLIGAFEGSMVDIEMIGMQLPEGNSEVYSCVLMTFNYRTRPQMGGAFTQTRPGHHEGPVHVGETRITWRAYAWTAEQVESFKELRDREDLEMLKSIDGSIRAAMDAIGEDMFTYLAQADETNLPEKDEPQKEEKKRSSRPPAWQPFKDIGKGVSDLYRGFKPRKKKSDGPDLKEETKTAEKIAQKMLYIHYKNFKKSHGMAHW